MKLKRYVEEVYNKMPNEFYGLDFLRKVRERSGRFYVFDDTILRYLRELREEGKINYKVIDQKRSKYKKEILK
jgi:hypothetical protein